MGRSLGRILAAGLVLGVLTKATSHLPQDMFRPRVLGNGIHVTRGWAIPLGRSGCDLFGAKRGLGVEGFDQPQTVFRTKVWLLSRNKKWHLNIGNLESRRAFQSARQNKQIPIPKGDSLQTFESKSSKPEFGVVSPG